MQAQATAGAPQQAARTATQPAAGRQTADGESHSIEEMVDRLAARLQQEPGNLEGWVMLGRSYFILKRYSDAAQAYSHAMALVDEEDPDLLADYAEALALAHGNTMAGAPAKLLERALAIDPDLGEAYTSLGALRDDQELDEESEEHFKRAIELAPGYATAYHWYAALLDNKDRPEEQLVLARRALDLDPMAPVMTNIYASALVNLGRTEQAIAAEKEGLRRNPGFPTITTTLPPTTSNRPSCW